jgi:4-amino-4-deoxy-L-arabinose transferase-like glycosyltransferase
MQTAPYDDNLLRDPVPLEGRTVRSPMKWAFWLAVCLAGILALRLVALHYNATDLFFDEAQYWSWSLEPAFGYYSKPPLIAWLIGVSTAVCGSSEFCVRLPSPIVHTLTAVTLFLVGTRLYGPRTGFWCGVVFATLPGVSFSSGLISTDVALLLFWAIALYALMALIEDRAHWWPAVLLGLALGFGLNAKYAMAYFVLCALVYVIATPAQRWLVRDRRWWAAIAIGLAMIVPNLVWNLRHGFATFAHTADNAKWSGVPFHPDKAAEFFLAQFGVFGPVLFAVLLVIAVRAYRRGLPSPDRFLLAFALPIVVIITVQALVSRAHANWAAVSYVAAAVLVTATMIRDGAWRWFSGSMALHLAFAVGIGVALAQARTLSVAGVKNPFARTLGWRELGRLTRERLAQAALAGRPYKSVLAVDRSVAAELIYYMRDEAVPVLAWPAPGRPRDHYQLTRPFARPGTGAVRGAGPALLVAVRRVPRSVLERFGSVGAAHEVSVPTGANAQRKVYFVRLAGFRGLGRSQSHVNTKGR